MRSLLLRITLPLSIAALLTAGTMTGCDKQEKIAGLDKTVQKAQNAEGVTSDDDFDDVFIATTGMLNESSHLTITQVKGGYIFTIEPGNIPASRNVVCHDTSASLSFAKCCRSYVESNGCIQVTSGINGWNGYPCPK